MERQFIVIGARTPALIERVMSMKVSAECFSQSLSPETVRKMDGLAKANNGERSVCLTNERTHFYTLVFFCLIQIITFMIEFKWFTLE